MVSARRIIAALAAVSLAAGLVGCVPRADDASGSTAGDARTVDVAQAFSANGIAIVPFAGGSPTRAVSGDTVLVLTEWQVENIQNGMRASGATISLDALDAAADSLKENDFDPFMSPSQVLLAWWGYGESPRADLARAAYPPPALNEGYAIPLYVLVLFEADTFQDLGRTDAASPVASGEQNFALGSDSVLALDACGIIGQGIDDVNGFLASAGVPPAVVGGAVEAAYKVVNALTGDALDYFYKVVGVINAVMTVGSLPTPWKVTTKLSADSYQEGLNGVAGDGGNLIVYFEGVVGQPPAEVKSCLDLFGLTDPTTLAGTSFQVFANRDYTSATIAPSLITVDAETGAFDENNTAVIPFGTGMQTLEDTKNATKDASTEPYIWLFDIKRSDVGKISNWIRTAVNTETYASLLGPTLNGMADLIEVAANPMIDPVHITVTYLTPGDPLADPADGDQDGAEGKAIGDCLEPSFIEQISGHTVIDHRVEQPATYSTVPPDAPVTALDPKATCIYDTDNGWRFQIVWPYTIWDDGALDLFLVGNAAPPPAGCSRISGHNLFETDSDSAGAETHSFVVWDGVNLATILVTGDGSGQNSDAMTEAMANALGWCQRPVLIDWHWEQQTFD